MKQWASYLVVIVTALSLIFMPCPAYAQILACDTAAGTPVAGTELFTAKNNKGACIYEGAPPLEHLFSHVICRFVVVLDKILDQVYCGLQKSIIEVLEILLTLYVAVFGAMMLIGTAQLNAKDAIIRLLKIAAVWAFATQSAYGIGITFSFFASIMAEGGEWVVNAIGNNSDQLCGQAIPSLAGGLGGNVDNDPTGVMPLYGFFDHLIYCAFIGTASQANEKVILFLTALIALYPPMYGIAWWWVTTTFQTLMRLILGFLMSLAALAFLTAMSPIFLSLMLFQSTSHFFEQWIRYLISFSIQFVLVLGIVVLWIMVLMKFLQFFTDLSGMIFEYIPTQVPSQHYSNIDTWAICPPEFDLSCPPPSSGAEEPPGLPVACCTGGFNPSEDAEDAAQLIPPSRLFEFPKFIYYVVINLVSLIIVTVVFNELLKQAPSIAQGISGPAPLPQLLGGWGKSGFGEATGHPAAIRPGGGQASANTGQNIGGLVGHR